jgi:hypothetical protein
MRRDVQVLWDSIQRDFVVRHCREGSTLVCVWDAPGSNLGPETG